MKIRSRLLIATIALVLVLSVLQISRLMQPVEDAFRTVLLPVGRFLRQSELVRVIY